MSEHVCGWCGKEFASGSALYGHGNSHRLKGKKPSQRAQEANDARARNPQTREPLDETWKDQAVCVGKPTAMFFAERTGGPIRDSYYDEARALCDACPVRLECLTYAIHSGETWGMWGGLTPKQRRRVRHFMLGIAS